MSSRMGMGTIYSHGLTKGFGFKFLDYLMWQEQNTYTYFGLKIIKKRKK